MLFAVIYKPNSPSEESTKRSLKLFMNWKPPFEFKTHYARSDGNGGIATFEAESALQALEGIAPWTPFFDFEVVPVVPIEDAVPVLMRVNEWRDSVS